MHVSRIGFPNKLILKGISCKWKNDTFTSNEVNQPTKKHARKMFEVNVSSIIAFLEL